MIGYFNKKKGISVLLLTALLINVLAVYGFGSNYNLPWLWPVPGSFKINSLDYYSDGGIHNQGQAMDIDANGYTGENRLDVISATSGKVIYICNSYNENDNKGSGWGNYVIVQSGDYKIVYAHLKSISCGYGSISAGDLIGKMGNTGNSAGVHLHVQTYIGSDSSSNEIRVFDFYKDNPLYLSDYKFRSGLEKHSLMYGTYIGEYYNKLSGGYFSYSGGLKDDFGESNVYAKVTVISSSGAPIRSMPFYDNSLITGTISYGKSAVITGYSYDAFGNCWLKCENGGWILFNDVGFFDYLDSLMMKDENLPEQTYGSVYESDISGNVSSFNPITEISVSITSGEMKVFEKVYETDDVLNVDLADLLSDTLKYVYLEDGVYTFSLGASVSSVYPGQERYYLEKKLSNTQFIINTDLSDYVSPLIEDIVIEEISGDCITISVIASDDKGLKSVELKAGNDDVGFTVYSAENGYNGKYTVKVSADDFSGSEYVSLEAYAYDYHGNVSTLSRSLYLGNETAGEVWVAGSAINLRTGPGTSFSKVKTISKGSSLTIIEMVRDSTYLWGKTSDGYWTVIQQLSNSDYWYSYQSGSMYHIYFDSNGSDYIVNPIEKRYGADAVIGDTVPQRDGYSFIGWSRSSDSKNVDFKAGDVYSENGDLHLFAVWEDTTPASIISVSVTNTEWTNDFVTVNVVAVDNTDKLFYSFDGGNVWLENGTTTVKYNCSFPVGSIVVRDSSGNRTVYPNVFVIENIDKIPPQISETVAAIESKNDSTLITLSKLYDDESGIGSIEIILSKYSDFSDSDVVEYSSQSKYDLDDGVYYWKILVHDNAGNKSEKEMPRFLVGDPAVLDTPENLRLLSYDENGYNFGWDSVQNCNGYELSVSDNIAFDSPVSYKINKNTVVINDLVPGTEYFARVKAECNDDVYSDSGYSELLTFRTMSENASLIGFVSLEDAAVDQLTYLCTYVAPYSTKTLDLTARFSENAACSYYADKDYTSKISESEVKEYSFSGDRDTVYIEVISEDGRNKAEYSLEISRASKNAEKPVANINSSGVMAEIFVGQSIGKATAVPLVSDGGNLSVEWYIKSGNKITGLGNGDSISYSPDKSGTYELYYVVSSFNPKCENPYSDSESDHILINVSKYSSSIMLSIVDKEYDGGYASEIVSGYSGNGDVTVNYYSDSACISRIARPTNAGRYYARAYASETEQYTSAVSAIVSFEISKSHNNGFIDYDIEYPTVRDDNTYVTISSSGVEYSLNGSAWKNVSGRIMLEPGDNLMIRFGESDDYLPGSAVSIHASSYDGFREIVFADESELTENDGIIFISPSRYPVTVSQLKNMVANTSGIFVYGPDGKEMTDGNIISGCSIVFMDSVDVIDSKDIVLSGDADFDGKLSANDVIVAMKLSNGMLISDNKYCYAAADVNFDGKITSLDALMIKNILGAEK